MSPRGRTRHHPQRNRSTRKHGSRQCRRRTRQGGKSSRRAATSRQRDGPSRSSPCHRHCPYIRAQRPALRDQRHISPPRISSPHWRSCTSPRCRTRCPLQGSRSTRKHGSRQCRRRRSQGGTSSLQAAPSRRSSGPAYSNPSRRRCRCRVGEARDRRTRHSRRTCPRWRSYMSPRGRTRHHPQRSRSTRKHGSRPYRRRRSQGGTSSLQAAPSRRSSGPAYSNPSRRRCRCRVGEARDRRTRHSRRTCPRWRSYMSPRGRTRHHPQRSRSTRKHGSRPYRRRRSQGGTSSLQAAPSRRSSGPAYSSSCHRHCPCSPGRIPASWLSGLS